MTPLPNLTLFDWTVSCQKDCFSRMRQSNEVCATWFGSRVGSIMQHALHRSRSLDHQTSIKQQFLYNRQQVCDAKNAHKAYTQCTTKERPNKDIGTPVHPQSDFQVVNHVGKRQHRGTPKTMESKVKRVPLKKSSFMSSIKSLAPS